jgi:hypothetical protein
VTKRLHQRPPARGALQLHHPAASGARRIATLDAADFSVYRIKGRKRFELDWLG